MQEPVLTHIFFQSGGTTLKSIYRCMKQTLAIREGVQPEYGNDQTMELIAFEAGNTGVTFVNVDTVSRQGILRAEQMGLVPSGIADLIVNTSFNFALEHLYDGEHQGRVISLFRHPIERLVSKFYYVQQA